MKINFLLVCLGITFSIKNYASEFNPEISLNALMKKVQRYGLPEIRGEETKDGKIIPLLYFGQKKINNTYDIVDNIKKGYWGSATIFVKKDSEFIRISTNILKDDGTRAIGTELAHNIAYQHVIEGKKYCGDIDILGIPYNTCYEAIKNKAGEIVALIYVGYKK